MSAWEVQQQLFCVLLFPGWVGLYFAQQLRRGVAAARTLARRKGS